MLKRFGLRMWAAADGSGVIIDHANFSQAPVQTLDGTQVESAELTIDWEAQPSCIIAEGLGAMDAALDRRPMTVVMVNELTGTDPQGNILPDIQTIISTFPGVTVLPLRPQLFPARADFYASQVTRPMFVKDDQARTVDQLSYFVRREMANRQNKAFHLRYTVPGATYQGKPWAINSIVQVSDPNLELDLPLWVMEREFECSRDGSRTHLTLIRPYTLALDAP
jgi:prophage tail gpP-like protein